MKAALTPKRAKKVPRTKVKISVSEILFTLSNPFILLRKIMLIPKEQGSRKPTRPNSNGIKTKL
jgi:hypothetical protein